jgi:hypothetical protein
MSSRVSAKRADLGTEIGYEESSDTCTQTGSGNKDVPGMTLTIPASTRPAMVTFKCQSLSNSTASGVAACALKSGDGSTTYDTFGPILTTTASAVHLRARLAPSSSDRTVKVVLGQVVTGNNSTLSPSATSKMFIEATWR